ncbi:hypothetical protein J4437_03590 [Candidatus Woesearchaeota archaeon]|nr:hypothetical protein [Candidatus Woesearchaeota archaeon]
MTSTINIKEAIILLLLGLILSSIKELIKTKFSTIELIFTMLYLFFLITFSLIFKDSISIIWTKFNSFKEKTVKRRLLLIYIWIIGIIISIIFLSKYYY